MEPKEAVTTPHSTANDAEVSSPTNEPQQAGPKEVPSPVMSEKSDLEASKTILTESELNMEEDMSVSALEAELSEGGITPSTSPSPPGSQRSQSSGFPRSDYVPPLPGTGMDATNVFIKYLPTDLTNTGLYTLFSQFGEITSCKVMVDPLTGYSLGYGFVRFSTAEEAAKAITSMYGTTIGTKTLLCKLSHGIPQNNATPSDNLYIKPLLDTTTEEDLLAMFTPHGRVLECKVMMDKNTGQSRQIGFVRFATIDEATKALAANNGRYLTDEAPPMVVKYAESRVQKIARRAKLLANQAAAESRRTAAQIKLQQQQQTELMVAEAAMAGDALSHDHMGVVGTSDSTQASTSPGANSPMSTAVASSSSDAPSSVPYIVKDEYGNVTFAPDLDQVESGSVGHSNESSSYWANYHQMPPYHLNSSSHHPHQHHHSSESSGRGRRSGRGGRPQHPSSRMPLYQPSHMAPDPDSFDGSSEHSNPSGNDSSNFNHYHGGPVTYRKKGTGPTGTHTTPGSFNSSATNVNGSSNANQSNQGWSRSSNHHPRGDHHEQRESGPGTRDSNSHRMQLAGKVNTSADGELIAPEWADDPTRLFISHLPAEYDASALKILFEVHGAVLSAKISQDKRSARPKTYGFVQFEEPADAARAVKQLHGTVVDGRAINVAFEATQSVAKQKYEMQQQYYYMQAPRGYYQPGPGGVPGPYIPRGGAVNSRGRHNPNRPRNHRSGPNGIPSYVPGPYYHPQYEVGTESAVPTAAAPYMYMMDPNTGVPYPISVYYPGNMLPYAAMPPEYYPSQPMGNPIPNPNRSEDHSSTVSSASPSEVDSASPDTPAPATAIDTASNTTESVST